MPRHPHLLRRYPAAQEEPHSTRSRLGQHAAQFQTPPSQGIPQLHPSSGPIEPVEPGHPTAAAHAALFSLFGRGVAGRPRTQMMDDNDEGEDSQFEDEDDHDGFENAGHEAQLSEEDMDGVAEDELEVIDEDEDEMMHDRARSPSPLPSNLREISSLASWTVSTHKPGCGVSALRHPSPTQYWQSDGPQPHTLSLHFFKLVAVVKIRVYLDFDLDESYTPTKMTFLAGMGGNDLVEFATWEGEGPCGWVDVPLEGVGGRNGGWVRKKRRNRPRKGGKGKSAWPDYMFSDTENQADFNLTAYEDDDDEPANEDDEDDPYTGNVLKAMVIQMRVTENHQNGKDTHVRGFQVFAWDDDRRRVGNAPSASADGRIRRHSMRKSLRGATEDGTDGRGTHRDANREKVATLEEPDWMGEPVIR
ncbi:galactose-binding domain-like protein [Aspergillus coremiiformis]|uniref:Galactose-binding domain-like protein n=1 Tax=Aspergillus coremiiformis TaxID=138285 RepID=A0A5N6ZCI1_9EURO|nr:galactose-binding domain-like protein [Aspergillus coremiiformis]